MAKLANTPIGVNTKVKLIRIHNLLYNIIHSGAYSTLLRETNLKNNIDSYRGHHYKCTSTLNRMNRMSKHKWNKGVTQEVLTKLNVLWNKIGADFKEPEFDYLFAPPGRNVTNSHPSATLTLSVDIKTKC